MRATLAADGVAIASAVVALHRLGPPEVYPPGQVPYLSALARGLMTLAIAVGATPIRRRRPAYAASAARPRHGISGR